MLQQASGVPWNHVVGQEGQLAGRGAFPEQMLAEPEMPGFSQREYRERSLGRGLCKSQERTDSGYVLEHSRAGRPKVREQSLEVTGGEKERTGQCRIMQSLLRLF